jgi:hypothetical protein
MNRVEITEETARISGVDLSSCDKVLKALEQVMSNELNTAGSAKNIFDMLYKLMTILKSK